MEYEIVNLSEKKVVGISIATSNSSPTMQSDIGNLWGEFYQNGVYEKVQNKANMYAIGLYSDYQGDNYTVTVGNEVSSVQDDMEGLVVKIIPAGRYAKFALKGHMQKVVNDTWQAIWNMELDRSFTGDFEEYKNADMENAEIDIYIALK